MKYSYVNNRYKCTQVRSIPKSLRYKRKCIKRIAVRRRRYIRRKSVKQVKKYNRKRYTLKKRRFVRPGDPRKAMEYNRRRRGGRRLRGSYFYTAYYCLEYAIPTDKNYKNKMVTIGSKPKKSSSRHNVNFCTKYNVNTKGGYSRCVARRTVPKATYLKRKCSEYTYFQPRIVKKSYKRPVRKSTPRKKS